jgi:hypothetical protein
VDRVDDLLLICCSVMVGGLSWWGVEFRKQSFCPLIIHMTSVSDVY